MQTRNLKSPWIAVVFASIMILIMTMMVTPALAAYSWMSQVRFYDAATGEAIDYRQWKLKATSSTAVFDVSISLYNNPQGDDDWTVVSTSPDDTEQRKYEEIIKYWADAIYESTNGVHKLGSVRIFRNGKQSEIADVIWNAEQWPQASISGFGTDGSRIMFGDIFPDGCGDDCDKDMLADDAGAGYTLGHEWGHYTYGLYDEYKGKDAEGEITDPLSTDVPVSPAIMSYQWGARGGHYEYLNFSTSNNIGDTNKTAQGRAYGASCWDTLIRDPKDDPKDGERKALPERTYYTNLKGNEPSASDNWIKVELPGDQATGRDQLDIIWMTDDIALQLVIDRSGSMYGTPLTNAQLAARTLVDVTQDGQTAFGLVSFNHEVNQDLAITEIPDPGTTIKAVIKAVINALTTGGNTAMYDAAEFALTQLVSWYTTNDSSASKVVFLLSDGLDNSSTATEDSVIAAYQADTTPLFTFGYGSFAPGGTLSNLADQTGGKFYATPTTLAEIQAAFLEANAAVSSATPISGGSSSAPAGSSTQYNFLVDETIDSVVITSSYSGALGDLTFTLNGPSGPLTETMACNGSGAEVSCNVEVGNSTLQSQGTGDYSIVAQNTTGSAVEIAVNVIGYPIEGTRAFAVTVATIGGSEVTYPAPVIVTATVSQGLPITGITLVATISEIGGTPTRLTMNDDGINGDAVAGDGIYSAIWAAYTAAGNYMVSVAIDNSAGTARYSGAGFQPVHAFSTGENGEEPAEPTYPAITTNFTRTANTTFVIPSFTIPNNNNIATASVLQPAGQAPNNTDNPGRIDAAGDVDYYQIHDINTATALVLRVTHLSSGFQPVLRIWYADGTEYGTADENLTNWDNYIYRTIPAAALNAVMYASVADSNATAVGATYNISAGNAVASDATVQPGNDNYNGSSGGGCFVSTTKKQIGK